MNEEIIKQIALELNIKEIQVINVLKLLEEDNTIGIIICKKDNKFLMQYCSDERILSKEYKLLET